MLWGAFNTYKMSERFNSSKLTHEDKEQEPVRMFLAGPDDWEIYKDIRIDALENNPEAFGAILDRLRTKSEQDLREDLIRDYQFYILAKSSTNQKQAQAIAGAYKKELGNGWQVIAVYTRPEFRRLGMSEKIIQEVLREIKKRGGTHVSLNVTNMPEQAPARQLYEKLGFQRVKDDMSAGQFYVVMEKDL